MRMASATAPTNTSARPPVQKIKRTWIAKLNRDYAVAVVKEALVGVR